MNRAEATLDRAYPRIDHLLQQANRRVRGARIRATVGAGLALSGLWALLAAWIGKGLGLPGGPWLLSAPPLLAGLAGAFWPAPDVAQTTEALQLPDPTLRSELRSAVELHALGPSEPGRGPSPELIVAHAAATAGKLGAIDAVQLLPAKTAQRLLSFGLALVLLEGFLAAFGPPRLIAAFGTLSSARSSRRGDSTREPITGDIELTYLYPAHTGLASRTVSGTDGSITAPSGTEVRLRTRADRDLSAAAVVVDGAPTPLSVTGTRDLAGSILCRKAGSYFFRFQDRRGRVLAEGSPIPIALQIDAPPQVSIESPATELEVDPKALVPIRYRADDDYGLSELALVYRPSGAEKDSRVVIQQTPDSPRHLAGETTFDLGPLQLAPGDSVSYTLEALDNDAVAGPKSGRATSHRLKIFSEAEHHREAIRQVRELWERLISLLGDRIDERTTSAPTGDGTDTRALAICDEMERAARLLQKDPASPPALPNALLNVARGERTRASATMDAREYSTAAWRSSNGDSHSPLRPLQNALDSEIEGLERDVLYLEALMDRQGTEDMLALSRELASRRRELADLIEAYRKTPTPQLKAAIASQVARLQERMNALLARMGELAKGLSDEHLNRQAIEELSKNKDMVGGLDKVKSLLAQGDVDGALKALDELGNSMDSMQKDLQAAAGEAGQKFPELARKVGALSKDLGKLTDEEKKLAGDTEQVRQRYRKALEQHAPASPSLLAKLKEQVTLAKGQLDQIPDSALPQGLFGEDPLGITREKVTELGRALDVKDLDQALQSADQAVVGAEELESGLGREADIAKAYGGASGEPATADKLAQAHAHARVAAPALEQIRAELAKLFPDQDRLLSPQDRRHMGELSQRQAQLRDELGQVQKDLQDVQKSAPLFDPSAGKKLDQAGGEMRGAQHSLNGRTPSKAVEQEQGAVEQLDGLEQSMRKMAKGGGGGGSQPFPMPFASGEGESGGQGDQEQSFDREKVVIPGADQYRVPPEFRRDILDAMRQKAPQQYEEQVKKYYQEIVR